MGPPQGLASRPLRASVRAMPGIRPVEPLFPAEHRGTLLTPPFPEAVYCAARLLDRTARWEWPCMTSSWYHLAPPLTHASHPPLRGRNTPASSYTSAVNSSCAVSCFKYHVRIQLPVVCLLCVMTCVEHFAIASLLLVPLHCRFTAACTWPVGSL